MAVAAIGSAISVRAEQARVARLARFAALVIDSILFGVVSFIVNSVYGVQQLTSVYSVGPNTYSTSVTEVPWAILTVVWLVYLIVFESVYGASPGKLAARLRVVRVDGRPLGVRAVVIRNLLRLIDWLPLLYLIGGVSVLVTTYSQRLGDRWAGTTVVYRHHALGPGETRSPGPGVKKRFIAVVAVAVAFTALFDYFGRPPLVIEGMFNTHTGFVEGTTSYTLGPPRWGLGSVTYGVTTYASGVAFPCKGEITLEWSLVGWTEGSGSASCA